MNTVAQQPSSSARVPRRSPRLPQCLPAVAAAFLAGLSVSADGPFDAGVIDRGGLAWTSGGQAAWSADGAIKRDVWSGRSGDISDSQESWVSTTIQGPARITFSWRVSSEKKFDFLRFRVNGSEIASISGDVDWTAYTHDIPANGLHTLTFAYTKDVNQSEGNDAGWVDSLSLFSGETSSVLNGFPGLPYWPADGAFWSVDTGNSRDGAALRSGGIGHGEVSSFEIPNVPGNQTVSFYAKTSSEATFDYFRFYVDGTEIAAAALSGQTDWNLRSHALPSGAHTLKWAYTKDTSVSTGADAAWLDSVSFTYAPRLVTQPVGGTFQVGGTLRLTALGGGGPGTTFTWKKDAVQLVNGGRISGADGTQLVISGLLGADAGSYTLTVENSAGSESSAAAVVLVPVPPAITTHPLSQTVLPGQPVTFNVAAGGTSPLSYRWRRNGTDLPGATASNYTIASVTSSHAGTYTAVVSNAFGSVLSSTATLVVPSAPVISNHPSGKSLASGQSTILAVTASSSVQPVTYQWKKDTANVSNGGRISGATTAQLTLSAVEVGDAGSYIVEVGNSVGSVTSSAAVVTVVPFNVAPTLNALNALTRLEDAAAQDVPLTGITDGNAGTQILTVTATSSNPSLVPHPIVTYTNPNATGNLSVTSGAGQSGTATVTVRVQDNGGTLGGGVPFVERQFTVTVSTVNDSPTLTQPADVTLLDAPLAGGTYTNDFNVNTSGGTLHGTAQRVLLAGNGKIELTAAMTSRTGGYFLSDLTPSRVVGSFVARFRAFAGAGSSVPADGFSFNLMGDDPATVSYASAETGVGTGLSVGFRIYSDSTPPHAVLKYNGVELARATYQAANVGTPTAAPLIEVTMTTDRKVTVKHNGTTLFDAVQTTCNPAAGWRFGFAARTGGLHARQLIDDVHLTTTSTSAAQVVALTGLGDGDGGGQTLTVTATSSNPSLVGNPTVLYRSPGSTGTLVLPTPALNGTGTAIITVRVQDNGGTDNGGVDLIERQFQVNVTPVNDAPTLNPLPSLAVLDVDGTQTVNLTGISDGGDGGTQTLTISATSSLPAVIPTPTITYTSPNATGTLQFTPALGSSGTVTITVTVQDNGGTGNGGANSFSRTFTVKVGPVPPVIDQAPQDQIRPIGRSATFAVTASGTGLTYKWFKNGTEIPSQTAASLVLNNVGTADAATYRVQVFNANTELIYPTAEAILAVFQPPVRATVMATQQASFTNNVTSPVTTTVQWLKDGEVIEGATGSTLTFGTTQSGDAAFYTVRITAGNVVVNTPPATLRLIGSLPSLFNTGLGTNGLRLADRAEDPHYALVAPSPITGSALAVVSPGSFPTPPWIIGGSNSAWVSPTARLVEAGSSTGTLYTYRTTFDLAGMELDTVRLTGQFAADDSVTDVLLNGLSILKPSGVTSNAYQAFTINPSFTSGHDVFARRGNLGSAEHVRSQANNVGATSEPGEPQVIAAVHQGKQNSVWWKWTAPANGTVVVDSSGLTSIASVLAVFTGSAVDELTLLGSDFGNGLWTQQIRTVTFTAVAGAEYQIAMDGFQDYVGDLEINLNMTRTGSAGHDAFASRASLGNSPVAAASGNNTGATGEASEPAASGNAHTLWWKWTSPTNATVVIDTVGSNFDTLLYLYTGSAIGSLTQVAFNDDIGGGNLSSRVSFSATAGTEYQIRVDGFQDLVGTIQLNVAAPFTKQEYPAWVFGTNTLGFVVKNTANAGLDRSTTGLRVEFTDAQGVPIPVEIVSQPTGGLVGFGDRKVFTVGVVSGSPVTYQWYRDNEIIEGATDATLTLNRVDEQDAGSYTVQVANLNGVRWSAPAVLLVDVPLAIAVHPSDVAAPLGGAAQFTVRFRGNAPLGVKWQRNGEDIPGATSATLNLPAVTVAHAGRYAAVVADRDASLTSSEAVLTVVEPPLFVQQPQDFSGVAGRDALQLRSIVDGSQPMRFRWFLNDVPLAAVNSPELNLGLLRATQEGTYRLVASNLAGAVTSRLAQVSVVLPPSITSSSVVSRK